MPPRATRKRKALAEVQNSPSYNGLGTSQSFSQSEYMDAIQDMIDNIDRAVEEKIHEINQATKNAVASLNTSLKTRLVRLPKALKTMSLEELLAEGHVKGKKNPGAREGATRAAKKKPAVDEQVEGMGVSKECKAPPPPPRFEEKELPSPPVQFSRAKKRAATVNTSTDQPPEMSYNGVPLQTPMPFAGKAVPMPVQMLTVQAFGKRAGGKTMASRGAPQAAVVTTKDGKQWAVGVNGLGDIPESHRKEVAEYLKSQFAFLQDALRQ